MQSSTVVIGANFGDEGKGLMTDFEVRRTGAGFVTRFNGGAQAGHTVVDGDKRHVFGHIGAGTFAKAATYLSSKFLVNPLLYAKEAQKLGHPHEVWMSGKARVSTIYDMVLNAIAETMRGANRHGSCGVGINETVTRHEAGVTFIARELSKLSTIENALHKVHQRWLPGRLHELTQGQLRMDQAKEEWPAELRTYFEVLHAPVSAHADALFDAASRLCINNIVNAKIVFEGAQGLMLDEFLGEFPHVTRSITGLPYAVIAATETNTKRLKPLYVTRAYTTRHGAGPLAFEGTQFRAADKHGFNPNDTTNVTNPWQGTLRFAPLNLPMLKYFIDQDIERGKYVAQAHGVEIDTPTLAITCVDQIEERQLQEVAFIDMHSSVVQMKVSEFLEYIPNRLGIKLSHIARGPEHKDVQFLG